jgi:hypothetical protein
LETAQDRAMPQSPPVYSKKTVRLPDDLWSKAQAQADLNGRSLNAEITARLIEAYAQPTLSDIAQQQEETRRLVRQVLDEIETLNIKK